MPRLICITRPSHLCRKNGTIEIREKGQPRGELIPVLQISEIFAFGEVEPDPALLSLLSQYSIPLHGFENGIYQESWMPYSGVVSGKANVEQILTLEDPERRWKIAKEILRGGARLRTAIARLRNPGKADAWEDAYLKILSTTYVGGLESARTSVERFRLLDAQRRLEEGWNKESLDIAVSLARAVVMGAFARLSLDPWIGVIHEDGVLPPLAEDLFFLLEPILIDTWNAFPPVKESPMCRAERFRSHISRPGAKDGGRTWSLRGLAVREGYAIVAHCVARTPYRAVNRVEIPRAA